MVFKLSQLYLHLFKKYRSIFILIFITSLFFPLRGVILPYGVDLIRKCARNKANFNVGIAMFLTFFATIYIVMITYQYLMIYFNYYYTKKEFLDIFYHQIFDGLENKHSPLPSPNTFTNIYYFGTQAVDLLAYFLNSVFPYIITGLGITIYLYWLSDSYLAISFLVINILLYILPFFFENWVKEKTNALIEYRNSSEKNIFDIFWNIYNILSSGRQKYEKGNVNKMVDNIASLSLKQCKANYYVVTTGRVIFLTYTMLVFYIYFQKFKDQKINNKNFTSIILVLIFCAYEFFSSYYSYNIMLKEIYEQKRILQEINESHKIDIRKQRNISIKKTQDNCILEIQKLYFGYETKKIFIRRNFVFQRGHSYSITGEIGCGKSTLLKIIFGILRDDGGNILLNLPDKTPLEYKKTNIQNWRKHFNYLQQSPVLFGRTIEENIYYGNSKSSVEKVIKKLGLTHLIQSIINERKLDVLDKLGEGVSGGQKQLINFLRIIANPKEIILMDEPTSSLDKSTREIFYKMFDYLLSKKKTIIVATHDQYLIKKCEFNVKI